MPNTLYIWPNQPILSLSVWVFFAMLLLYVAREPGHRAMRAGSRVIANGFRMAAASIISAQKEVARRNRQVLLQAGRESAERQLEQEFQRVSIAVTRDLGAYPALHRKLSDQIVQMDDDYRKTAEAPPSPGSWTSALEMVDSRIEKTDNPMAVKVLEAIKGVMENAHQEMMGEYREESRKRHDLLNGMMPFWRNTASTLEGVNKTISGLEDRSRKIDEQMSQYREMVTETDRAQRTLSSSSMTQFVISGLVLVIAILGGFVNFQLIALPMSEMVGGGSHLGTVKTSDVAALVIIMVEVAMGLFLMESLRITRLFPVIGTLDDRMRKRMMWATFTILFILASIESSLAYMRDLLAADREALTQALSGVTAANPAFRWIPSMGQMIMGFILPFALTFVAIPLESFVHSSRTVLGVFLSGGLKALSFTLRLIGKMAHHAGSLLVACYDLIIFIPLRIEALIQSGSGIPKLPRDPKKNVPVPQLTGEKG